MPDSPLTRSDIDLVNKAIFGTTDPDLSLTPPIQPKKGFSTMTWITIGVVGFLAFLTLKGKK